jgi:hypothetical protein
LREVGPLGLDEATAGGIGAADDGIDEGAPGGEVGEVTMAAQQQRLAKNASLPILALGCIIVHSPSPTSWCDLAR